MEEETLQGTETLNDPQTLEVDKPYTLFDTEQGIIHVIHEITLGDLLISTLLLLILAFIVISRIIRR